MVGRGAKNKVLLSESVIVYVEYGMLVWWGEVSQERWREFLQKGREELQSGRNGLVEPEC